MKIKDIAAQYGFNEDSFTSFIKGSSEIKTNFMGNAVDDSDVQKAVQLYKTELNRKKAEEEAQAEKKRQAEENERMRHNAISSMLVTSGFNFDGYTIKRYSGYISGDDVVQIPKEKGFFTGTNKTDVGEALSKALVKIRAQALKELKEAAYDLGCNAIIGVDFDYITLDPEVHNGLGTQQHTEDLPYVFCVTANGNAVEIEKN